MNLTLYFPNHDALEQADVRAVAGAVLKSIVQESASGTRGQHIGNLIRAVRSLYPAHTWECSRAVSEALAWLAAQGLLCQSPDNDPGFVIPTRAGLAAAQASSFEKWSAERELPAAMLHEVIVRECMDSFRLNKFDTAVFEAFKTLEVAIRDKAGLGHEMVGVSLASRAFHPEDGPLTDMGAEKGERVALMNLMTGALGSYKNPHSHRKVELSALEAREMLILASHLLRIVDSRTLVPIQRPC